MNKLVVLIMVLLSISIYHMNHTKPVYKEDFKIVFITKINKNKKTKKWRY